MSAPDPVVPMAADPFLNTDAACGYLGVPKATLLTWRVRRPGYGPRAVKAGGRLKYRLSELDRWLGAHEESSLRTNHPHRVPPGAVRTRTGPAECGAAALRIAGPDGVA